MAAVSVGSAAAALVAFDTVQPRIVLIGLPLSDSADDELATHFAATGTCGVIVATADWAQAGGTAALDAGADDVVAKPLRLDDLAARLRALARRIDVLPMASLAPSGNTLGVAADDQPRITVDATRRCLVGPTGERTLLTEAELSALETLLDAKGASVSREWLGRVALRRLIRVDDRSVDQLVMKLRRKLTSQGVSARAILSARRQGYVIPEPALFRATVSGAIPAAATAAPGVAGLSRAPQRPEKVTLQ